MTGGVGLGFKGGGVGRLLNGVVCFLRLNNHVVTTLTATGTNRATGSGSTSGSGTTGDAFKLHVVAKFEDDCCRSEAEPSVG
jgi:hypothetical protein